MKQTIPTGWEEKNICDICEVYQPQTISSNELLPDGKYVVFGANGVIGKYNNYNHEKPEILVTCRGATCGSINRSLPFSWINGNAMVVSPKNESILSKSYLYYFLIATDFRHFITGAAQPQITRTGLSPLKIFYPSLLEQQRISEKLDTLFANIEKERQIAQQNLQNARDLFDNMMDKILTGLSTNVKLVNLKDVCIVERGSSPRPIKSFITTEDNGVNWIRIGDCSGKYVTATLQKITPDGAKKSRFVKSGDFIISNSMSYGKPYILKIDGCIHDGWFVLRLQDGLINPDFLYYVLSSIYAQKQYDSLAAGAIVLNISSDLIKKVSFPLPDIKFQEQVVQQLDSLSEQTQQLEHIYTQQIADLDELKQAILKKAFNGEL